MSKYLRKPKNQWNRETIPAERLPQQHRCSKACQNRAPAQGNLPRRRTLLGLGLPRFLKRQSGKSFPRPEDSDDLA
jgi:hypothetical protein